ncbi:MAG TPA: sigma-54-dependent Fis family transcriptional regulator [Steroidobacteraceae bacterium]|nr:sigma-54-dependent Fis family transcriptional regulator [Steroidobacteraceae bacterium]
MTDSSLGWPRGSSGRDPGHERAQTVASWHDRARRFGLSERLRPDFGPVATEELRRLGEQHRDLQKHAVPVMELLYQQILNTHSMVILTDERGLILHALGDADFLQKAERVALRPGVLWSEDSKGTNAIGTALADRRATLVHGSEHFLSVNRFLTCSCSPIIDPHGRLVGALDVSGSREGYHAHTMALVRMSTQMIENQLFVARFGDCLRVHFHARPEFLGTLVEGIAAFDEDGRLLAANPSGLFQLGVEADAVSAQTLSSVFGVGPGALLESARAANAGPLRLCLQSGVAVAARAELCAARRVLAPAGQPQEPVCATRAVRSRSQGGSAANGSPTLADLDTGDPAVAAAIAKVRRVQRHGIPIMILGETGTGKELLAQAIHKESTRRDKLFVAVDCASVPEALIEAELFGYEEGAFTGARRGGNPGKLVLANGGTLFLDEIGDMPLALQTRLLRALQERAVQPLGGRRPVTVDTAVICATHRDLKAMVQRGEFREDLFYRLNGLVVRLPALRERQDLEALVRRILRCECAASGPMELTPETLALLRQYGWPGNIRQLANVLRTASAMAEGNDSIGRDHLPEDFLDDLALAGPRQASAPRDNPAPELLTGASLQDLRASVIVATLRRCAGNISAAARALGVSRNTVYRMLKELRRDSIQ